MTGADGADRVRKAHGEDLARRERAVRDYEQAALIERLSAIRGRLAAIGSVRTSNYVADPRDNRRFARMLRVRCVCRVRGVAPAQKLVAVVAWRSLPSNARLVDGWRRMGIRAELLCPPDACRRLGRGDVALVRLDVMPALDSMEAGLGEVGCA